MSLLKTLLIFVTLTSCVKTKETTDCEKRYASQARTISLLKEIDYLQTVSNGISLKDNIYLINEANDMVSISAIEKPDKTLFFYYSITNCTDCVDREIERMKKSERTLDLNIKVISDHRKARDLLLFKQANNLPFSVYRIVQEHIDLPISSINIPFYFVLDKYHKTKFVYTPYRKENTEFTDRYFEAIQNHFIP